MDWIPSTIDAVTRLAAEVGGFWLVAVILLMIFALIAWRHSGSIVAAVGEMVKMRQDDAQVRKELSDSLRLISGELSKQSSELTKQSSELSAQTLLAQATNAKLDKLPSDVHERVEKTCRYKTADEVIASAQEVGMTPATS